MNGNQKYDEEVITFKSNQTISIRLKYECTIMDDC